MDLSTFNSENISSATTTVVKSGTGVLHAITINTTAAAAITVYDNTAESGTVLYQETFTTTAFRGFSVTLDVAFGTGLYIGFTTTTDVAVTPSWR